MLEKNLNAAVFSFSEMISTEERTTIATVDDLTHESGRNITPTITERTNKGGTFFRNLSKDGYFRTPKTTSFPLTSPRTLLASKSILLVGLLNKNKEN